MTATVWAEHSVWPQDPGFHTALAGGVTSLQVLPGSANLVGGRGVTLKNVPATTYQEQQRLVYFGPFLVPAEDLGFWRTSVTVFLLGLVAALAGGVVLHTRRQRLREGTPLATPTIGPAHDA